MNISHGHKLMRLPYISTSCTNLSRTEINLNFSQVNSNISQIQIGIPTISRMLTNSQAKIPKLQGSRPLRNRKASRVILVLRSIVPYADAECAT